LIALMSWLGYGAMYAQSIDLRPYIEVNGHAEEEVTPDEIYMTIHLSERLEGRDKISLEEQEEELYKALEAKGLNMDNLVLSDSRASLVKVKWKSRKNVLEQSDFEIMVSTADEVGKVFEVVDELKLKSCVITKTDYSKREAIEKKVRVAAIKDAANQADYLLEAIGETRGKPIIVRENQTTPYLRALPGVMYEASYSDDFEPKVQADVSFKKIKIESRIYVKFEIE